MLPADKIIEKAGKNWDNIIKRLSGNEKEDEELHNHFRKMKELIKMEINKCNNDSIMKI